MRTKANRTTSAFMGVSWKHLTFALSGAPRKMWVKDAPLLGASALERGVRWHQPSASHDLPTLRMRLRRRLQLRGRAALTNVNATRGREPRRLTRRRWQEARLALKPTAPTPCNGSEDQSPE